MERVLKILLISIITFLLALWVITAADSCKDKKARQSAAVEQDSVGETIDPFDIDEDIFGSDAPLESGGSEASTTKYESDSDLTNYVGTEEVFVEEKPVVKKEEKKQPQQATEREQPAASSNMPYMIVAGSYIDKRNAEIMKKKLIDLNFNRAEIVNFDYSQYHSVLAGRYRTEAEARELAGRLKNRGIECYVQRQKK
jgi:cell division septation protein DedD